MMCNICMKKVERVLSFKAINNKISNLFLNKKINRFIQHVVILTILHYIYGNA
jgi:hypothetical protein